MGKAEISRSQGNNQNKITIDIDGLGRTIVFKKGGSAESPYRINAEAAGGITFEGLYDAWRIEGEVTVSKDLAIFLMEAFMKSRGALNTSAVYETYSSTAQVMTKHSFANARVHKMPHLNVSELGAEVSMKIAFSLNDLITSEVVSA